ETCSNQCTIEAAITNLTCDNNNTPADSTDDQFYFDLTVTGSNTSSQWSTTDGLWSGTYGNPVSLGPFPIHEESVTLIIIDDENPNRLPYTTLFRSETCSNQCTIEAAINDLTCDNNNTPADSTD